MIVTVKIRQYLALDGVFAIQTNPAVSPICAVPSKHLVSADFDWIIWDSRFQPCFAEEGNIGIGAVEGVSDFIDLWSQRHCI